MKAPRVRWGGVVGLGVYPPARTRHCGYSSLLPHKGYLTVAPDSDLNLLSALRVGNFYLNSELVLEIPLQCFVGRGLMFLLVFSAGSGLPLLAPAVSIILGP